MTSGAAECRERERRIELPGAVKRLSMGPNGWCLRSGRT